MVRLSEDHVDVVDYSGRRRRPASETEAELLRDREYYSPAILEGALRAKHGLEPWLKHYADLAPDETRTTARLFGSNEAEPEEPAGDEDNEDDPDREHSVFVYFSLEGDEFGTKAQRDAVFQAEEIIEEELARTGVGELGGNEFGGGQAALFAYGPDADVLLAAMAPHLRMVPLRPAYVLLRYGGPDRPQIRIDL